MLYSVFEVEKDVERTRETTRKLSEDDFRTNKTILHEASGLLLIFRAKSEKREESFVIVCRTALAKEVFRGQKERAAQTRP